jgi:hypothetical protein
MGRSNLFEAADHTSRGGAGQGEEDKQTGKAASFPSLLVFCMTGLARMWRLRVSS